jgi:hypothetical protein
MAEGIPLPGLESGAPLKQDGEVPGPRWPVPSPDQPFQGHSSGAAKSGRFTPKEAPSSTDGPGELPRAQSLTQRRKADARAQKGEKGRIHSCFFAPLRLPCAFALNSGSPNLQAIGASSAAFRGNRDELSRPSSVTLKGRHRSSSPAVAVPAHTGRAKRPSAKGWGVLPAEGHGIPFATCHGVNGKP